MKAEIHSLKHWQLFKEISRSTEKHPDWASMVVDFYTDPNKARVIGFVAGTAQQITYTFNFNGKRWIADEPIYGEVKDETQSA